MRIAICEDNAADSTLLVALLTEYSAERLDKPHIVRVFSTSDALLAARDSEGAFDCYLLDVLLGEHNGVDLAKELRHRGDRGPILFLTNSPEYALAAFSVHAADYLLKPISRESLFNALDIASDAHARFQKKSLRHFTFRTPSGLRTTPIGDIVYIEIMGHTPFFHLTGGVVPGSAMRVSFEESVAPLLESTSFLRPHRSFLVNAAHVVAVTPKNLRLNTGTLIPVARTRAAEVKARYLNYLTEEVHHD